MANRVDHALLSEQIAENLGEGVLASEGITDATIIATAIDALRHATLALVEQQRIANLIALGQATHDNGSRIYWRAIIDPSGRDSAVVRADIREGLGL